MNIHVKLVGETGCVYVYTPEAGKRTASDLRSSLELIACPL
jgi:hypothetical protein